MKECHPRIPDIQEVEATPTGVQEGGAIQIQGGLVAGERRVGGTGEEGEKEQHGQRPRSTSTRVSRKGTLRGMNSTPPRTLPRSSMSICPLPKRSLPKRFRSPPSSRRPRAPPAPDQPSYGFESDSCFRRSSSVFS